MTTVHFDYTNQNIQGLIRSMFLNTNPNGTLKHTSTIKHQTAHNVNLDLFVDSLHDKLARIFCVINRAGGLNITLPCPKTVEEDDLFDLQSKNPPANKTDEKVIEHFINSVVTKTVIPLFDNINQNELRIKDIFKFFFLLCFSNLLDPADTSGENFIKHLRTKLNSPNITLPFEANGGIFTILSNHTYSMCGDKLLYAYILRLYPTLANPGNPGNPWSSDNVRDRHLVILNFAWQCTLTYIQSISNNNARFPRGGPAPNPNFPNQGEINIALNILREIEFVGFILQSPEFDDPVRYPNRADDYRHYTYANATFIFRGEDRETDAKPFAVSQGIAAECINELYQGRLPANAALPREGSPHRYKVLCKIKLQQYINAYRVNGQPLTPYQKSVIYVLLKFAGDTSHLVNYMLLNYAIEGRYLPAQPGIPAPPVLLANGFFNTNQLKATIFCCERALIARCIQENHSFYCRDVKVLSQEVPLALGDCYYFNVDPLEEYRIKNNLIKSFRASAGGLQGEIDWANGILTTFIGPPQGFPISVVDNNRIGELVTFINFYKAYMLFKAFITNSRNKYTEFVETIIPSQFRVQTRIGRIRKVLNICTPLSSLFESLRKKKNYEKASLIYSSYYGPLVSILSQLENPHIRDKATTMGLNDDIRQTLQTIVSYFTSRINMLAINGVGNDDDIRSMLSPDNNHNDTKMTELIINIIKCQKNIDIKLTKVLIILSRGQNGGADFSSSATSIPPDGLSSFNPRHPGGLPTPSGDPTGGLPTPPSGSSISYGGIKPTSSGLFYGFTRAPAAPAGAAAEPAEPETNGEMSENEDGGVVDKNMVGSVNTRNIDDLVNQYITHARGEYSYIQLARVISNLDNYSGLYTLFNIDGTFVRTELTKFANTVPPPVELYSGLQGIDFNVLLLLQYFSSMVDHQVNLNILEEAENETLLKLRQDHNIAIIEKNINQLRGFAATRPEFRSYQDLFISIRNNQEIIHYLKSAEYKNYTEEEENNRELISKRPYFFLTDRAKRMGGIQEINFDIVAYIYLIKSIKSKQDLKDALIKLRTKEGIDGLNILLKYLRSYRNLITRKDLKNIREQLIELHKGGYILNGLTSLSGGKNIRSISKMYRKNNKRVKNVKKTRKNKKNNDKKQKTSKKMTKTSVQNKKSIKNKSIKNMKNTKNKKVNKSKTKKGKKN